MSKSEAGVPNVTEMSSDQSLSNPSVPNEWCHFRQHAETVLKKMESYFLKEQLTDVVLIAGDRRIPAHRLILSAGSEYFAAMFTGNLAEATQSEIELKNVNGDALWTLVHYCYSGSIQLMEETVEMLMITARLLQLHEVVDACCTFLKKQLHPSNCIGIQRFADSQSCTDLLQTSQNYIAEHFLEVVKNQEFLTLSGDEFARLLASDDLNVFSEEDIFSALVSWLEHDITNKTDIGRLLSYIKLPLLSPSFIVDNIESVPLFQDNSKCTELIMEAFKYQLLPERRSKLKSRRTFPRKSTLGDLYVLGGTGVQKVVASAEKYDARLDKWEYIDNMNIRRLDFGVGVVEGKIYVVGGRDNYKTLDSVECYDMEHKKWTIMPAMSTERHGLGVGVLGGPLYAVGGHDKWSFLNSVERWDPQAKTWSNVAPMSVQRAFLGVGVLNGKLYAIGGRNGNERGLKTVECYDPHTDKWTSCASMAKQRSSVGVGVLNGYLYVVGGHSTRNVHYSLPDFECVERYNPQTDVWEVVASMSAKRDAVAVGLLGERLFAVGGCDGGTFLKTVEAYDPDENEWHQVASLNKERAGACVITIKN